MTPESENPIPSSETGPDLTEATPSAFPEGFYNPEKERVPVPRTEAGRTLTKLVSILAPGTVNPEGIDSRHQVDAVATEFQEILVPTKGRHKDEFMETISPLLTRLEQIGLGDYQAVPHLKNIENYTVTDDERIVFDGLFVPWQYRGGTVVPAVDIEKLKRAVANLPDTSEAEVAAKTQAELYVDILEASIQEEMGKPIETLIDRLDEPNLEHLETLRDTLDSISDEMIAQVGAITEEEVAKNSANRELMKSLTAPLITLMRSMYKNTKIGADDNHSLYPEFWQLVDRYDKISCAMGITNNIKKNVRHEVSPLALYRP